MLPLLFTIGLMAAGAALITRALVPQHWLLVKPFSCDLCMSWWGSLVSSVVAGAVGGHTSLASLCAALGGTAVSVVVLKAANRLGE